MSPVSGSIAAMALSHDPAAALAAIEEHLALHGPSPEAGAVRAFVHVLTCQFEAAAAWVPQGSGPLPPAMADFISAVCMAEVPAASVVRDEADPDRGLLAFITVEAAMSAGQITRAEAEARAAEPALTSLASGTFSAWNRVALSRSLAFQGRFTEARAVIETVLVDPRRDAWPAVGRIARGVRAFVMAHEGEPQAVIEYVAELRSGLPEPRTYLESAAFILAAFAEQAAGQMVTTDELVLLGGGGDYLPRYQIVDRVYGYEILVEHSLDRGDIAAAQRWLELAEALPVQGHHMAVAVLGRSRARIAMALNDPATGERESALAEQRAALVGGSLEVLRAQLLQAAASRAQGVPVDGQALERIVQLAASTGARVVREWAVQELAHRGRRLRNVPGLGWDSLTDRQRLVAVLAAQGLRNREIAAQLFVSERTVEGHVGAVLDALGTPSRVGIGSHIPVATAGSGAPTYSLTPRQRRVADLIAEGCSNAVIAATLGISEKTVEKHVADLFVRLAVQSRAGVAALIRSAVG